MTNQDHVNLVLRINYHILQFYETQLDEESRQEKRVRLFNILPCKQGFTICHVPITNTSIKHVLKNVSYNPEAAAAANDPWQQLLNYDKRDKYLSNKRRSMFSNYLTTDGVSVSLLMKTDPAAKKRGLKKKKDKPKRKRKRKGSSTTALDEEDEDQDQRLTYTDYNPCQDCVVGVDPGMRAFITASFGPNKEDKYQLSGTQYDRMAGTIFARQTRQNIYKQHMSLEDYQTMITLPSCKSTNLEQLQAYYQTAYPHAMRWIEFHLLHDFRKLNLYAYKKKHQALDKICNQLLRDKTGNKANSNVYIGFGNYSSNQSRVKGHQRRPILGLKHRVEKHRKKPVLINIDEYKTSKICSFCFGEVKCQRRVGNIEAKTNLIYGAVRCPHNQCQTGKHGVDRDVNAARNIRYLTMALLEGSPRPSVFARAKKITEVFEAQDQGQANADENEQQRKRTRHT